MDEALTENSAAESNPSAEAAADKFWGILTQTNVADAQRVRPDLMTWRRGSAQMVVKINAPLHNFSIYSVLVTGVQPSEHLYKHLLAYNVLQRKESLGLMEKNGISFIVLKYTMDLDYFNAEQFQHHVFTLQDVADRVDTELAATFGGQLHFDDWEQLNQDQVDDLLNELFTER